MWVVGVRSKEKWHIAYPNGPFLASGFGFDSQRGGSMAVWVDGVRSNEKWHMAYVAKLHIFGLRYWV